MALLTNCTSDNRVILQPRIETFSKRVIQGHWTYTEPVTQIEHWVDQAWELHRYCSAHYKYVGITYQAAKDKAYELSKYYTRNVKSSIWDDASSMTFSDIEDGWKCMTQISINRVAGCMFELEVRVNEDDSKLRSFTQFTYGTNPVSFFTQEHNRGYEI